MNDSNLLSLPKAAAYLGISPHTLRQWSKQGDVPVIRLGKLYRFALEDLDQFIGQRRIAARKN